MLGGGPKVPTPRTWTLLGRHSGDSQRGSAIRTLSNRVCALVSGLFTPQEIVDMVMMLAAQSCQPAVICIHIDPSIDLDSDVLKNINTSIEIIKILAKTRNEFLESIPRDIKADYFLIVGGHQFWSEDKLQSDLSLANETLSSVLISPFNISKNNLYASSSYLDAALVNNEYTLRQQVLLTLIGQHGSALISASGLDSLSIAKFVDLTLSSSKLAIQLINRIPYPMNFEDKSYVCQRKEDSLLAKSVVIARKDISLETKIQFDQILS